MEGPREGAGRAYEGSQRDSEVAEWASEVAERASEVAGWPPTAGGINTRKKKMKTKTEKL